MGNHWAKIAVKMVPLSSGLQILCVCWSSAPRRPHTHHPWLFWDVVREGWRMMRAHWTGRDSLLPPADAWWWIPTTKFLIRNLLPWESVYVELNLLPGFSEVSLSSLIICYFLSSNRCWIHSLLLCLSCVSSAWLSCLQGSAPFHSWAGETCGSVEEAFCTCHCTIQYIPLGLNIYWRKVGLLLQESLHLLHLAKCRLEGSAKCHSLTGTRSHTSTWKPLESCTTSTSSSQLQGFGLGFAVGFIAVAKCRDSSGMRI